MERKNIGRLYVIGIMVLTAIAYVLQSKGNIFWYIPCAIAVVLALGVAIFEIRRDRKDEGGKITKTMVLLSVVMFSAIGANLVFPISTLFKGVFLLIAFSSYLLIYRISKRSK